jgi:hypothetical protein
MAEFNVRFEAGEWSAVLRKLGRVSSAAVDFLTAAYMTLGLKNINDHFQHEQGPAGPWAPRKDATQRLYAAIQDGKRKPPKGTARAAYSPSNKLLQLTGNLRKSFLNGRVEKLTPTSILAFSPVPYSGRQDRGEKGSIARPFMWLDPTTKQDMANLILRLWIGGEAL